MNHQLATYSDQITKITPASSWLTEFKELREYRDLFYFLIWREIKVRYAQTVLGFGWAIINPVVQIIIFTIIFGNVAKVNTDGIPYILFSTIAVVPWTYMTEAMTGSSQSLISGQNMLGKIYFPRLLFPITPVLAKMVDFGISLLLIAAVLVYYQVSPTWNFLLLPLFIVMMMSIPAGIGLWLSSLAIRFRDVKFVMPFIIRMLIYTAPILYSASAIPENYRIVYSFNPIVGVVEGYRSVLLGYSIPWVYVLPGMFTAIVLVITGAIYFKKMERIVVDVI